MLASDEIFLWHLLSILHLFYEEMLLKLDEPEIFCLLCDFTINKQISDTSTLFPDSVNTTLRLGN